jgi:hypothetical protein
MATYIFGSEADATTAAKVVGVLVGDMEFYQPITINPNMFFSGQWVLTVPNLPPDMLGGIADSIRPV